MPFRTFLPWFVSFPALVLLLPAQTAPPTSTTIDFTRDIEPILRQHCHSCHGPQRQRSGLRLDRRTDALRGGDSGPAMVPGKSSVSPLLQRVQSNQRGERMPPGGERLPAQQIALLRAWIDQGAVWPEAVATTARAPGDHWSFRAVVRPTVPVVKNSTWVRNPIDHFVLAALEAKGLTPNPEAERATLIRRLKFDLLGLPPTPEEVAAFVQDRAADAYEQLVERYLRSPHHGERWARHWLDVVRFAESDGFEMNQARRTAWPYRDYVIQAFNADKPYDRFVQEQLAGDALGADEATAFLVGGPVDRVKSPDLALTLQQRADEVNDMISTTTTAFLGLTAGCARCHDHKFDPISQLDYHALKAIFAGVQHGERPRRSVEPTGQARELVALQDELQQVQAELLALEPLAQPSGPAGRRLPVNARQNSERFTPIEARFVRFTVEATSTVEPCIDELEIYSAGEAPRNVALATAGAKATSSGNFGGNAFHRLEHIHDGRHGNGRSWISSERGKGWVQIELKAPTRIDHIVWGRDREGKYADRLPVRYHIEAALQPGAWKLIASSADRLPLGSKTTVLPGLPANEAATWQRLNERRADLSKRLAELNSQPLVYAGVFRTPEPVHRLHRGDPQQKRELVGPGVLGSIGPKLKLPADLAEQQRRLALARWITDPQNPLTARVLVNRLWQHHFGTGIVNTPSDFGRNGASPSHPELLDWLASEFVSPSPPTPLPPGGRGAGSSWSLRHIHRLIVTSATYRQSSRSQERGLALDAQSRLLWRYPPQRLEAEPLRDSILFVSGKLDLRLGGPGFDLFEPNSNYVKVYNSKKTFGPAEWRRLIYQSKPRMQLDDTFGAFDCPDAGQIAPKRTSSTTALQALNLLNSSFIQQQSDFFAERLRKDAGSAIPAQVQLGFRLAFQRTPSTEELQAAVRLVERHGLASLCRALFNANEFLYIF